MDKAKYEKPMLVELGFDSEVMGTKCKSGPQNPNSCTPGNTARNTCALGASQALPTVCSVGSTPSS